MGINLKNIIKDVEGLFTKEEAKRIFEAAGYDLIDSKNSVYKEIKLSTNMIYEQSDHESEKSYSFTGEKMEGIEIHLKSENSFTPSKVNVIHHQKMSSQNFGDAA